jgi:inner membrane protein
MNSSSSSVLAAIGNFFQRRAILFKIVGVAILILLLLIPLNMIRSVLSERLRHRDNAVAEVTSVWGREQDIIGPVLIVPYRYSYKTWKEQPGPSGRIEKVEVIETATGRASFLPARLAISGEINPSKLRRGIYDAVVYSGKLSLSGHFAAPSFENLRIPEQDVVWEDAILTMAIPDLRGVKETIFLDWGGRRVPLGPGSKLKGYNSGVHARVPGLKPGGAGIDLKFDLSLNGSGAIRFAPLAGQTTVKLTSPWPDPSFRGAFLPSDRKVSADGFEAVWQVSEYGRNFPQQWTDQDAPAMGQDSALSSLFGVHFLSGVDSYRNVERAIKYGVLFLVLVFAMFFLFELLSRLQIHPFQYTLVGFALCLFYLGLLSLSEFIRFGWAYFISATLTTGLIWFYCVAALRSGRRAMILTGLLAATYTFLYVTLQSQDYSLLIGTTGLFLALAAIFFLTRNIDWYNRDKTGIQGQNSNQQSV